jgi:RNA polymerase sigma-70 factor, ECF subfamily
MPGATDHAPGPPAASAAVAASAPAVGVAIERVYRESYGAVLATTIRFLGGDFDTAEEAVADAFAAAVEKWPRDGIPIVPAAWLTTAARNRALDRIRRGRVHADRLARLQAELAASTDEQISIASGGMSDDRLRLVFTCCHPALPLDARIALTLRTLGGLSTPEIARAFLVPEPTLAQRLVRARRKIREAGIPYKVPDEEELPERLDGVLATLYLVFNEGYLATAGDSALRPDLCVEAIRLAGLLVRLLPDRSEAHGLLALLLLQDSRRDARVGGDGAIVLLVDQDRARWDRDAIARGLEAMARGFDAAAAANGPAGRYLLQAAVAAEHARTADGRTADWRAIAQLYEALCRIDGSPVVALNHAVAVAQADGPAAGLALLDPLDAGGELIGYHLLPAARADMLNRLGRAQEAAAEYRRALALTDNNAERRFLERRLAQAGSQAVGPADPGTAAGH